ncbi:cytochrome P450 4c21-like [Topomyia yanbarensis]|uniref:cytochrome P450 4c21-like n=1 Tax=Topomyia yanbarensis TaxID=2498891 RepID=UPI00273AFA70|nr:cytochrome P450 4c21-like [Topomyia yanbarensis]
MIVAVWAFIWIAITVLVRRLWNRKVQFAKTIPRAEPYYPVLGNLPMALGKSSNEMFHVLHECFQKHDRLFTLHFGPLVAVGVTHPELIQTVLNHPDCQEKPDVYKVVRLPKGLLASRYETWKVHRKTLNSTFNIRILYSFLPIFNDCSRKLINRLNRYAETGEICNVLEYISECTLEMISRTSLGGKALEREGRQEFIENLEVALTTLGKRIFNVLLHNDLIYRFTELYRNEMKAISICHQFTDKIIAEKHIELGSHAGDENGNVIGKSFQNEDAQEGDCYRRPQIFIDQLMKMPLTSAGAYSFTDQEISDHIYTMIVAGNETSATQLAHTCLLLAMHPEVQERAFQEVNEIITSADLFADMDVLKELVYVEAVLKEAMRLMPVAPIIARENLRDVVLDGRTIPKGTLLLMNFYSLHRREDIWGSTAEQFEPQRFLGDEAKQRHAYAHLPFSGGPRGCIGYRYAMMSLKMLLAFILKNFKLSTQMSCKDIKYHYQISLNLACSHAVRLEKRL